MQLMVVLQRHELIAGYLVALPSYLVSYPVITKLRFRRYPTFYSSPL